MNSEHIKAFLSLPNHEFVDKVFRYFHPRGVPAPLVTRLRRIFPQCERCMAYEYEGHEIDGVRKCACPNWEELNAWPERPKPMFPMPLWWAPNEMTTYHRSPTYGERLHLGFAMLNGVPL